MKTIKLFQKSLPFVAWLMVLWLIPFAFAQKSKPKDKKEELANAPGEAVLWREPTDIATRNLLLGPGGEEMKPDLSSVTFVKDTTEGYSVKYEVRDGHNQKWVVKVGNEARPETAAVRLVWAASVYCTSFRIEVSCAKRRSMDASTLARPRSAVRS